VLLDNKPNNRIIIILIHHKIISVQNKEQNIQNLSASFLVQNGHISSEKKIILETKTITHERQRYIENIFP